VNRRRRRRRFLARQQLAARALTVFTSEELAVLAHRRATAEDRHGAEIAAGVAETFWTEIDADPDTTAAFEHVAAEWTGELPPKKGPHARAGLFSESTSGIRNSSRYGAVALDAELARLAEAEHGERNRSLNLAAYHLGRLVGAGHLDAGPVIDALFDAGQTLGLPAHEIKATVRSGLDAGTRRPRR
jgi:hypothetical protein